MGLKSMSEIESAVPPVFYVLGGIVITAAAQIFLKVGSSAEAFKKRWFSFLLLSLASYGLSFVSYYLALKHYEISKVSPIMMASIISLVSLYGFLAGEALSLLRVIGILVAVVSIILISRS